MRKLILFLVWALVMVFAAAAKELPDMPKAKMVQPRPVARATFWDRTNKIEAVAMISLAVADQTETCHGLTVGRHETNLTQSCGKNLLITAGENAGAIGLAYFFRRTGHHKLERIPMLFMAEESARGIGYTVEHGGW